MEVTLEHVKMAVKTLSIGLGNRPGFNEALRFRTSISAIKLLLGAGCTMDPAIEEFLTKSYAEADAMVKMSIVNAEG